MATIIFSTLFWGKGVVRTPVVVWVSDYLVHQLKGFYFLYIFCAPKSQSSHQPAHPPDRQLDHQLENSRSFSKCPFWFTRKGFSHCYEFSPDYINRAIGTMAKSVRLLGAAKGEVTSVKADHRAE